MIAIAKNDPALGHALAKASHGQCIESTRRHAARIANSGSVKTFLAALHKHLGDRLVAVNVVRPTGSRANARALVLEPVATGLGFTLARIDFDARRGRGQYVDAAGTPVLITHHAVARAMQRSTGAGDIGKVADLLRWHLIAIVDWYAKNRVTLVDGDIEFSGNGGSLIGDVEAGCIVMKTWLDAASTSDRERRRLASDKDQITSRFTPEVK